MGELMRFAATVSRAHRQTLWRWREGSRHVARSWDVSHSVQCADRQYGMGLLRFSNLNVVPFNTGVVGGDGVVGDPVLPHRLKPGFAVRPCYFVGGVCSVSRSTPSVSNA